MGGGGLGRNLESHEVSGCTKLSLTPTSLHFFEGAGAS